MATLDEDGVMQLVNLQSVNATHPGVAYMNDG
jgi:hypothetical protein